MVEIHADLGVHIVHGGTAPENREQRGADNIDETHDRRDFDYAVFQMLRLDAVHC